ncbi:MAG: 4-amino-4-deoxychorismate lyase [Verrucomicrobia bacterium]|nr:MAG: 4-amino-4-deoxychorismate lyase [Verrucomicrobiota bacterium]|tara:strand:+ start:320 stop:1183 length:864 start_codon:yes stop_codon:yes gene_type:complete
MDSSCNNKEGLIWLNGEFVQEFDARVSVFDHGLLTGDGVFETLIAYDNNPFAYTRHYRRLERSAKAFNLNVPDINLIRNACVKVLDSTSIFPARLRITITGGVAPLGSEKGRSEENVIIASNIAPVQPDFSDVITVSFPRNEHGALSGLKTTSYGENVIALAQAHSVGAKEAIFGNVSGNLCEGTGSNIFVSHQGKLITPPLSSGCLAGVTRSLVIEICERFKIPVSEENLKIDSLENVEFAFLTSTLREVQPIETINGIKLPIVLNSTVQKIKDEFKSLISENPDP